MLTPQFFLATVEDREDPLKIGRVRVRVDVTHPTDKTLVPTESLPWSMVSQWIQSAGANGIGWAPVGPIVGTRVFGCWLDGQDQQIPMVLGVLAGNVGHLTFIPPDQPQPSQPTAPAATTTAPAKKSSPKAPSKPTAPPAKLGTVAGDRKAAIAKRLADRYGLTNAQAAGLVGNLDYESGGLSSNRVELTNKAKSLGLASHGPPPAYGTTSIGYSWAQWTNPAKAKPGTGRLDKFIDYSKANNLDPQSDEAAYQYLTTELDPGGSQHNTIKALKATSSVDDATKSVMNVFEHPKASTAHLDQRVSRANKILKSMTGVQVPVRTTGTNATDTTPATKTAPDDQPKTNVRPGEPPQQKFDAQYPYNKTYRSESGHLIEIDDSPGKERLLHYHKTGSYDEIRSDGTHVVKVIGDQFTIVVQDDTISIEGSATLNVNGNINITCYNDVSLNAAGSVSVKAAEKISIQSASDINLKSAGDINMQADGQISMKASGDVAADGATIQWNGGKSKAAAQASGKKLSRKKVNSAALTQSEAVASATPDDPASTSAAFDAAGITDDQLVPIPLLTASDSDLTVPVNPIGMLSSNTMGIESLTSLTDDIKLGQSMTLGNVLSTVTGQASLVANRGLDVGAIGANLSLLTQNILEPLYEQFPQMKIVSSFVPDILPGTSTSLHGLGQAASLSFGDISTHFDIAAQIKESLPFHQITLCQKWIDISYVNGIRNANPIRTIQNALVRNPVIETGLHQYWADAGA